MQIQPQLTTPPSEGVGDSDLTIVLQTPAPLSSTQTLMISRNFSTYLQWRPSSSPRLGASARCSTSLLCFQRRDFLSKLRLRRRAHLYSPRPRGRPSRSCPLLRNSWCPRLSWDGTLCSRPRYLDGWPGASPRRLQMPRESRLLKRSCRSGRTLRGTASPSPMPSCIIQWHPLSVARSWGTPCVFPQPFAGCPSWHASPATACLRQRVRPRRLPLYSLRHCPSLPL